MSESPGQGPEDTAGRGQDSGARPGRDERADRASSGGFGSGGSRSGPSGTAGSRSSWEDRASGLADDVQRWLLRAGARSVRNEIGDQVKKTFGGGQSKKGGKPQDVWASATTESAQSLSDAPECAWCPVCRAARRVAQARLAEKGSGQFSDVGDVITGAIRDVLSSVDSVLSYRPGDYRTPAQGPEQPAGQPGPAEAQPDAPAGTGPRVPEPDSEAAEAAAAGKVEDYLAEAAAQFAAQAEGEGDEARTAGAPGSDQSSRPKARPMQEPRDAARATESEQSGGQPSNISDAVTGAIRGLFGNLDSFRSSRPASSGPGPSERQPTASRFETVREDSDSAGEGIADEGTDQAAAAEARAGKGAASDTASESGGPETWSAAVADEGWPDEPATEDADEAGPAATEGAVTDPVPEEADAAADPAEAVAAESGTSDQPASDQPASGEAAEADSGTSEPGTGDAAWNGHGSADPGADRAEDQG
jgi:hypothetical protein